MQLPRLESPRLILRPYHESDFDAFAALNSDADVRRHVGGPLTHDSAAKVFQSFMRGGMLDEEVWAVTMRETGDYVGHGWISARQGASDPEVGFLITPRRWRQGYGTEVAMAVIDYAMNRKSYSRIVATVDVDHFASIRVLEKAGMKRECEQRDEEGVYFVYSIKRPNTYMAF